MWDIDPQIQNIYLTITPACLLILYYVFSRVVYWRRWHEPPDALEPNFSTLGAISRIHREPWATWRQTAACIYAVLSQCFFIAIMIFVRQGNNPGSLRQDTKWRIIGLFLLSIDSMVGIGAYKNRVLIPRIHRRSGMLGMCVLRVFWAMMFALSGKRLDTSVRNVVNQPGLSGWPLTVAISWITESAILSVGSLATLVLMCIMKDIRDDIIGELSRALLDADHQPINAASDLAKQLLFEKRIVSPERGAPLWKTISFTWIDKLIRLGRKRNYTYADFFHIPPDQQPVVAYARFKKLWLDRIKNPHTKYMLGSVLYKFSVPTTPFSALTKFVYDSSVMINPIFLSLLVNWMSNIAAGHPEATKSLGLSYVALMSLNGLIQNCLLHVYFHKQYMLGLELRSVLSTAIYTKSLLYDRSSAQADPEADYSSGKVINLMSVDTQKVSDLMAYIHIAWSAPYQIIITSVLLWFQLKWAAFAGIAIMLLGIPVTKWISSKMRTIQQDVMTTKDTRIKRTTETLTGIRAVKFYVWEDAKNDVISDIRKTELHHLRRIQVLNIWNRAIVIGLPALVAVGSFLVYTVFMREELTPAIAFTSLALFNNLRFPLIVLPNIILSLAEATVTIDRIQKFLLLPELKPLKRLRVEPDLPIITVSNLEIQHSRSNTPVVSGVTFSIQKGRIVAVVGCTGSGKTSLVSALVGDLNPTKGCVEIRGSVAYCGQTAWIQTGAVRDNILFNNRYSSERYNRVIKDCALTDDLAILADGDSTEIGERGINLSGGQKQRVALARAVYANADAYILDDVLSAVDPHVAEHIFFNVLKGSLKDRAILLVTHKFEILDQVSQIIFLLNGEAIVFNDITEAMANPDFRKLASETIKSPKKISDELIGEPKKSSSSDLNIQVDADWDEISPESRRVRSVQADADRDEISPETRRIRSLAVDLQTSVSFLEFNHPPHADPNFHDDLSEHFVRRSSSRSMISAGSRLPSLKPDRIALIDAEKLVEGKVAKGVYSSYIKAAGRGSWWLSIWVGVTLIVAQGFQILSNLWLSRWSSSDGPNQIGATVGISVFTALNLTFIVISTITSYILVIGAQRASKEFHVSLLNRVLHAKLSFFESTPMGRTLNLFAKDIQAVDELIPQTLYQYTIQLVNILGVLILIVAIIPLMLTLVIPMIGIYLFIEKLYVNVVRQFRRIESILRAPVLSNFSESNDGCSVIRAFHKEQEFKKDHLDRLNANLAAVYISNSSNRWLAFRLETLGTALVGGTALLSILGGRNISAALGGLALSYAINCVNGLNWLVRMSGDREANVVAVERLIMFNNDEACPQEQYSSDLKDELRPHPGEILFKDVCLQYRPGLPYALKNVTFRIAPGEKVGVVGRTGAGKSSLMGALLRLVEIQDGDILINGVSTKPMSVTEIRTEVSIIPQESTLFTGTLRSNLDPFNKHADESLKDALRRGCLQDFLDSLNDGLEHHVTENGGNLSAGQRQLICLARLLLRNTKIVLLDEATSAVDPYTDSLVQEAIRTELSDFTVVTIAHRIRTVIDYDKILVMADGQVAEFDTPANLLANPDSIFRALADSVPTAG